MIRSVHAAAVLALLGLSCAAASPSVNGGAARRPFVPYADDRWIGRGVCYGPHRDGQRPGDASPTRAQLREDLALLGGRFDLLRLYASDGPSPDVLALIKEERLPFKVLVGAWIAPESAGPTGAAAREANRLQVEGAVRLANAFPDLVIGLVVGNETQVGWSAHQVAPAVLVGWLREARRGTAAPVATADDFGFWVLPESERIAREVDYLVVHAYALWNGRSLEDAVAFTRRKLDEVAHRHPGVPLVLGEVGWATAKHTEGDQATLIKAEAGEEPQARFFEAFTAWVTAERITSTWFEAFDEGWKGGPHPDEVEKHWGLWHADRTPKPAVAGQR